MSSSLIAPFDAVRDLVPDNFVPVMPADALALLGVIEWLVAEAIRLGYFAVRSGIPRDRRFLQLLHLPSCVGTRWGLRPACQR